MADLTISGLRALLDADPVADAPMGSIVDTRDWDGDEGDRREWMRTGPEAESWWLVDGDEDDYSDTERLTLAGGLLTDVAVPVGLLRELLDAAAERDEALRRVAELEVALEPDGARRLELAKKLAISASNLLRIERDEARARAAAHETDAANLEDRVAELEGLLVQAEDYARDAALEAAADTADSTTPEWNAPCQAACPDGCVRMCAGLTASDAGPAGSVRIEWGHRLPLDMPGRERYTDVNQVSRCHTDDHRPDPGMPCEQTHTYRGDPLEHVWRLAPAAGGWRTGTPPEATP